VVGGHDGCFLITSRQPTAASASRAEDTNVIVDYCTAVFTAYDAEVVVDLYAPGAILLGTVNPVIAEGSGSILDDFN